MSLRWQFIPSIALFVFNRKVLLKIKPLLLNIELGVIVALLPFVDALKSNNIEVMKNY